MNNPRPVTDAEKDASISRLLRTELSNLADGAIASCRESGRGLWVADFGLVTPGITYGWFTEAAFLEKASQGAFQADMAAEVTGMIAGYDPRREFVLVAIHPDNTMSWQVVGHGPMGRG